MALAAGKRCKLHRRLSLLSHDLVVLLAVSSGLLLCLALCALQWIDSVRGQWPCGQVNTGAALETICPHYKCIVSGPCEKRLEPDASDDTR